MPGIPVLSGTIAAIGDIHGCFAQLENLLEKLESRSIDRYVFLGDYIDRGPQTRETLSRLWEFSRSHDCVFLSGNHDLRAKSVLFGEKSYRDPGGWIRFGGIEAVRSMTGLREFDLLRPETYINRIPEDNLAFLKSLNKIWHLEAGHIFVHGGLRDFSLRVDRQDDVPADLRENLKEDPVAIHWSYLNVRQEFFAHQAPHPEGIVVHGHTRVKNLVHFGFRVEDPTHPFFHYSDKYELISIDVDTGAYDGNPLSAVLITDNGYEVVQGFTGE